MTILWIILYALGFVVLIILTQDLQVFPGALFSVLNGSSRNPRTLPHGVESIFVTTADGKRIEVWRYPPADDAIKQPYIGLAFHGNGGSLESFFAMQLWFHYMGITSYGFDYRGFGKSSGWPSEQGIERDSDAFWNYVVNREQVDPSHIIILGFSVGSAPAARIASIHQPTALVLVSPFTELGRVIREQPMFKYLASFAWYKFPTIDYVRKLEKTSLLLAHSEKDHLIRPYHTGALKEAYRGNGGVEILTSQTAGHNSVFFMLQEKLGEVLFHYL